MSPSSQKNITPKKLIIAMMDWGLGHTTRCIPIIRQLQEQQCCITIAANMTQKKILASELHDIEYLELEGYNIRYSKKRSFFLLHLILQLPRFISSIKNEQRWLQKIQESHRFQAVISDNRYGFYLKGIPSVFITHQLSPITGISKFLDYMVRVLHYQMIRKFDECWIPDNQGIPNFTGRLSHPKYLPKNSFFIGLQSRFQGIAPQKEPAINSNFKVLAMISGPEPQRTNFENILLRELKKIEGKCILIRGLPQNDHHKDKQVNSVENSKCLDPGFASNIQVYPHLDTISMYQYIRQSELVICRSGYSSIMDLVFLHKKALLIPTPGQTEQEYLARKLQDAQIFPYMKQEAFEINMAMKKTASFPFAFPTFYPQDSVEVIARFTEKIRILNN